MSTKEPWLSRVLGEGESPVWWALPAGALRGVRIRVHVVAPVVAMAVLAHALWSGLGVGYVLAAIGAVAVVVVVREEARRRALRRWQGRRPAEVTLWPLGGLWKHADDLPDDRGEGLPASAAMGSTLALAAVGVAAFVLSGGEVAQLAFDPFRPRLALGEIEAHSTPLAAWLVWWWTLYAAAVSIWALNLLPMPPLDGGRILGSWGMAPERVARVGLLVALVLVVAGLLTGLPLIAAVGLCGGVYSWERWQSARFAVDPAGVDRWRAALASQDAGDSDAPAISDEERDEVERILAKISAGGMASLSRAERRNLHRATERLRDR